MSSLTPNLGLYLPDETDDFGEFRAQFNGNMNILDQGGGGSSVSWNQILQSGTKIAEVTISGTTQDVYAPSGGGGGGGGGGESMVHIYSKVGSDRNRISESISHVIT